MKILLIEDDYKIAEYVTEGLSPHSIEVQHATRGDVAFELLQTHTFDAVLLDLTLPGIDGMTVLNKFREIDKTTPVIVLSAKYEVDDKVGAFREGSDDYLTKPFSVIELHARLEALFRRENRRNTRELVAGDLRLDRISRAAFLGATALELQRLEFDLLSYFMERPNQEITKKMLIEDVWKYRFEPNTNIVEIRIFKLREKLKATHNAPTIENIRGVGYVFKP